VYPKLQNLNRAVEKKLCFTKNALNFPPQHRGPGWLVYIYKTDCLYLPLKGPVSLFHTRTTWPISNKFHTDLHTNSQKFLKTSMIPPTHPPDPSVPQTPKPKQITSGEKALLYKNALNLVFSISWHWATRLIISIKWGQVVFQIVCVVRPNHWWNVLGFHLWSQWRTLCLNQELGWCRSLH